MFLCINDIVLDFIVNLIEGWISFYDWLGGSYVILFLYLCDFMFVCIMEFGVVV